MENVDALVSQLATLALDRSYIIATAESCTGGLIAGAFTEVSGSSMWFDRGFVTYSNHAKQQMLGVRSETLHSAGAVSEATVLEMATGALQHSDANLAVSVSGVAGPTGGSSEKPVGTVWIACASAEADAVAQHHCFVGDRHEVRAQAVNFAIRLLIQCIESDSNSR